MQELPETTIEEPPKCGHANRRRSEEKREKLMKNGIKMFLKIRLRMIMLLSKYADKNKTDLDHDDQDKEKFVEDEKAPMENESFQKAKEIENFDEVENY